MNKYLQSKEMFESGYTHYKVDSISFVSKRVQKLADYLSEDVDLALLQREDSTMRDIDINMARLFNLLGNQLDRGSECSMLGIDQLYFNKQALQSFTAHFVLTLIDEAEAATLDRDTFQQAYADSSQALPGKLDLLDQTFGDVMRQMHEALTDQNEFTSIIHASTPCRPDTEQLAVEKHCY